MKFWSTLLLFIWSYTSIAQTTVYQGFEADTAAEPRGGMAYLTTFLQTNLRKPTVAEAKGVGGRVVVSGIIETDGRISEVKLMNSFRPDCDREALRVFGLFNDWKPAHKDGKSVRQQVSMPVTFKSNPPFIYENGTRISYFDADEKLLPDSSKARYKQTSPIDSLGIPVGDIVLYKAKGNAWKEERRMPLIRKSNGVRGASGVTGYFIGYANSIIYFDGLLVSIDDKGSLLQQVYFKNGKRVGIELLYHPTGAVAEKNEEFDEKYVNTAWYQNGQIKHIRAFDKPQSDLLSTPVHILAVWDSTGQQSVKEGKGWVNFQGLVRSRTDTTKYTLFTEQGSYENGYKQGTWQGRYADGSYSYEEEYDKGITKSGKTLAVDGTLARYTVVEKQPEFKGGMQALGQFLSQNLHYPVDAQRARVQGRVFVSFVIGKDGDVDDVRVLKRVGFGVDEEAMRVVKATSGLWQPGTQRGEKVRVKYNLPINFTLN